MNHRTNRARRLLVATAGAVAVIALGSGTAAMAQNYPPEPPSGDNGLNVDALAPYCVLNVPSVSYSVRVVDALGVTQSSGPVTVTVRDLDGNVLQTMKDVALSGSFTYPGASVGADGKATDWPGWVQVDGTWVEDPTDARLRDGLAVTFAVGSMTASKNVGYSAALDECDAPAGGSGVASQGPTTPGQAAQGAAAPAQGSLPSTGNSGTTTALIAAAVALLLGLAVTMWSKNSARRHADSSPLSASPTQP